MGEPDGIVLRPGEGTEYHPAFFGELRSVFKAEAGSTDGHYTLTEERYPAGLDVTPHIHLTREESFYVLAGELEFRIGARTVRAEVGTFLLVPRGVAHSFRTVGERPARMLALWSPAGFEGFYRELAEAFPEGRPLDRATVVALWRKYDTVEAPRTSP